MAKHGKNARLFIGGTSCGVQDLNLNIKVETADATTTKTGGARVRDGGLQDVDGNFTVVLATGEEPEAVYNLAVGNVVVLKYQPDTNAASQWKAGYVLVESLGLPIDLGDVIKIPVGFVGASVFSGAI